MSWQQQTTTPPPGYAYGPRYSPSWPTRLRAFLYIAAGRPRSLARDGLRGLADIPTPPMVRGEDNIPERGAFVLVANHYERPGLWMAWPTVYMSSLVLARAGRDVHWIAIQEWESFRILGVRVPPAVTRAVFERAFRTYGIVAMAPANAPAGDRAASMRAALKEVRKGHIVGIMPEGDVGPTPEMLAAREGAGTFLLMMAAAGARILPVGLFEEEGGLVASFGEAVELRAPRDIPKDGRDRWARDMVMRRVRDLLPEPLWGVYR